MAEAILLREGPGLGQVQWLDLAAPVDGVRVGGLAELTVSAQGRTLILVWPAAQVLLLEIDLPLRNAAQIAKALPFALEDLLAEDVDHYHLTWHRPARSQRIAVAAVGHDAIAACIGRFNAAGMTLSMAVPEPLLLPWQEGRCSVLFDGETSVIRYGEWLGGGGEKALSLLVLHKLYADGQLQGGLALWSLVGEAEVGQPLPAEVEQQAWDEPLLLYTKQWQAASVFNLLNGAYAPKTRRQSDLKRWLPAVAVLMIALLAQLAGQWQLLWRQQQQLQTLEANTQALFKQTFPDIKRLVNVKVQADQQLSTLQAQSQQQMAGFLPLLYRSGNRLKTDPQLKLLQLQYGDDSLLIKLLAPDAAGVEQFKRLLSEADGLHVDIRAVVGVKDGVEAEVAIQQN